MVLGWIFLGTTSVPIENGIVLYFLIVISAPFFGPIITYYIIKKFLEIDYPRSKATRYYANFLALRAT